jgi:predicted nucleic acid-binding protein
MRIVVDTNVIVSALVFGGLPRRVFEVAESGGCELYYSAEIESETRRVLHDKSDGTRSGCVATYRYCWPWANR